MTIKSSHFDLDFSKQYKQLKKNKDKIQAQIMELNKDNKNNFQQIHALIAKREIYRNAIIKLLNQDTEKPFEQYAKKMFNLSISIIEKFLSLPALKFDKLSNDEKQDFGQTFINYIAKRFKINTNTLLFNDNMPTDKSACYDFYTGNIEININQTSCTLQDFISMILHEFTHHLYEKHPEYSPLGEQKVAAIMENPIADNPNGIQTESDLIAYKQRPYEAPAYYLQEYFEKHKFGEQLLSTIKNNSQKSTQCHQAKNF